MLIHTLLRGLSNKSPGRDFAEFACSFRLWREQFDFAYREYDTFIFPMSIHPQVSGKPQVILMHERSAQALPRSIEEDVIDAQGSLIDYINRHEGVE